MSEIEATNSGPAANPADNVGKWLEDREAAKPAAEPTAAPVDPAPAEPAPVAIEGDWWETGLANVGHGFLRGKKGADVENAFRSAESRLKQKESEAANLKRELDAVRRQQEAEEAARKVYQQSQAPAPAVDPNAEIERNWFDNPKLAAQQIREQAVAEARQFAAAEAARVRQETQAEQQQRQYFEAGGKAYDAAQAALNLDKDTWNKKSRAVYLELTDKNSPYYEDGKNIFRPEKIVATFKELWGDTAPAPPPVAVKPAPEPPTPPGSKRPAAVGVASSASPLAKEEREAMRIIAGYAGIDADRFIKRGERRG